MFGLISPQGWLSDGHKKLPVWYRAISTGACFTDPLLKSKGREGTLCVREAVCIDFNERQQMEANTVYYRFPSFPAGVEVNCRGHCWL